MATYFTVQSTFHAAIIMDGNGRWALARGLPRAAGHRAGVETVSRIVEAAPGLGIGVLTLFAFSADNWQRPSLEVEGLMALLSIYLAKETPRMYQETLGPGAFLEAGSGALNFPAILKVAQAAGVKYYFVEQDETGGDPIESLRRSFAYFNR